jgi:hypothetical protein
MSAYEKCGSNIEVTTPAPVIAVTVNRESRNRKAYVEGAKFGEN